MTDDSHANTIVEIMNICGTLNRSAGTHRARVDVPPRLKLPTSFHYTGFKEGEAGNTIVIICNEGWDISLRIHNASSKVEPSLKFDVQLISTPSSLCRLIEFW